MRYFCLSCRNIGGCSDEEGKDMVYCRACSKNGDCQNKNGLLPGQKDKVFDCSNNIAIGIINLINAHLAAGKTAIVFGRF